MLAQLTYYESSRTTSSRATLLGLMTHFVKRNLYQTKFLGSYAGRRFERLARSTARHE